ncbi:hypothetical protein BDQ17DRAFT_1308220 [Cyathus striatus]|nr:hypothetical protein BDQ17DRAFT_1308220 [Cyathus striatus]
MGFLGRVKGLVSSDSSYRSQAGAAPPVWAPAPEISHALGKFADATEDEFEAAESFCSQYPPQEPSFVPSYLLDRISEIGCKAWGIERPDTPRFQGIIQDDAKGGSGTTRVHTTPQCQDTCLLSDLPIMAGLYDIQGKTGVYYEVLIHKMEGIISVGTSCRPYPVWRLPGWNRLSAGLHLDDFRKFFEDPDGGRDYTDALTRIGSGDVIGCGYEFATGTLFYTYNGMKLPPAFSGIYMPRVNYDVFAAIGVEGCCDFEVNFGGDYFRWKEGNEWAWRIEGHIGRMQGAGRSGQHDETLPTYYESVR